MLDRETHGQCAKFRGCIKNKSSIHVGNGHVEKDVIGKYTPMTVKISVWNGKGVFP